MKKSFTLAEVLITLGIIGVIAAMTIPTVINSYKKQETLGRVKKVYSLLSQAIQRTVMTDGWNIVPLKDSDNASIENWYQKMFGDNLKVVKYCLEEAGCWNSGTLFLNGTTPDNDRGNVGMGGNCLTFVTADGYFILLDAWGAESINDRFGVSTAYDGLSIYVDINGEKKPNVIGKDVFVFTYTMERGLLPAGRDRAISTLKGNCPSGNGMWCLERIIRDGWSLDNINF